eukprot:CAMPEP_0172444918 /NCGR_PEP_ID=MMETSP1065-20121228/4928_1 /TAXON_ID=265537 /ORGANISM="Amphiprora paludosa, Strain CCMP125" /LENGTH=224 /DNA_ID=CAMNT_0013195679 /DNA_START=458 /DNA_END=1132 /DNA_ORIENTATION=+
MKNDNEPPPSQHLHLQQEGDSSLDQAYTESSNSQQQQPGWSRAASLAETTDSSFHDSSTNTDHSSSPPEETTASLSAASAAAASTEPEAESGAAAVAASQQEHPPAAAQPLQNDNDRTPTTLPPLPLLQWFPNPTAALHALGRHRGGRARDPPPDIVDLHADETLAESLHRALEIANEHLLLENEEGEEPFVPDNNDNDNEEENHDSAARQQQQDDETDRDDTV